VGWENHLVDPYVLPPPQYIQNAAQEIRENRDILNRVWLSWIRRTGACIENENDDTHNYSPFTLLFSE
jgi:hypothetical protein